jgi:hypothetical protein
MAGIGLDGGWVEEAVRRLAALANCFGFWELTEPTGKGNQ